MVWMLLKCYTEIGLDTGSGLRGTLSLRKPVPAILAFISHFRLKQLDLRNDQVHVDRLAAVL